MSRRKKCLEGILEPAQRRVRAIYNDQTIADSTRVRLMRESSIELHYYFPEDDVAHDTLQATEHVETSGLRGDAHFWHVRANGQTAEHVAWTYPDPPKDNRPDLRGWFAFKWGAMDHWYEEDEEVFGHPRDPYHRIDTVRSSRHVRVEIDGVTVADTRQPVLLLETRLPVRYYIPRQDVQMDLLTPTDHQTICPYKGFASYWSVTANGQTYENLVWAYNDPLPDALKVKELLAFYNEKVDIFVDGQREDRPQTIFA